MRLTGRVGIDMNFQRMFLPKSRLLVYVADNFQRESKDKLWVVITACGALTMSNGVVGEGCS